VVFTREIFSSAPDQVLVVRLSADKPGAVSAAFRLSRPGNLANISIQGNEISLSEHVDNGNGIRLVTRLKVLQEGGNLCVQEGLIRVEKADHITLFLTAATDYRADAPAVLSQTQLYQVAEKSYADLKAAHIADYQQYFKRVDLNLGSTDAVFFPTNQRIAAMQKGSTDPQQALYYQFGRYLLISSSHPGGLPANLQGIWADGLNPPWDADYHININIQMNYWPSEICNLSEMHLPFLQFLDAMRPDGHKTARDMYGMKGTVAHFTTDAWHFTEPYGQTQWAMWPMGMAWGAQHFWEHYLFTEDRTYLENLAYPAMKDAAVFCADWLTENPATKQLVSGPSISPENTFKTASGEVSTMVMGPAMDHMIIRNLLENAIAASEVLKVDADFRKKLRDMLARLAPTQEGSDGRIMEWTEEFEEPEPGHRHISQLFGLHPGNEITRRKNPELMEAARKTIDYRLAHGGGHTGWSRAWIINFFARLYDGESAYQNLLALLRKSTLPNLFDNHPPFQIDGNLGATAGMTDMLLQSHAEEIELLPALPTTWNTGYIHGICARGGFEIDLDWENGILKQVVVLSKLGNTCTVRYGDKTVTLQTIKAGRYVLNGMLR